MAGPVTGTLDLSAAETSLVGEVAGDNAGYAVASGGDVDGDGYDDVLVGAPEHASVAGAAYLFSGDGLDSTSADRADAILTSDSTHDCLGSSVAGPGDLDGDGNDDLLIGARWDDRAASNAGAAFVFLDASGTLEPGDADAAVLGQELGDWAGSAVSGIGDHSGDGTPDFAVGAPLANDLYTDAGRTVIVFGGGW